MPDIKPSKTSSGLVITNLAQGVRNPNRVNVFLNSKFAFSLDIGQVVDFGLKVHQELTESQLKELKDASEFGKVYQNALEWVLARPRSVKETKEYLRRRQSKRALVNLQRTHAEKKPFPEISDSVTARVLERLIERNYIDDLKFAEYFVENRHARRGISHRRLEMELRHKGISASIIKQVLSCNQRPESEEIQKIIEKKRHRYDDERLVAYLVRQGFSFSAAREAIADFSAKVSQEQIK